MKLVPEFGYAAAGSHGVKTSWLEYVIWSYAFKNKEWKYQKYPTNTVQRET